MEADCDCGWMDCSPMPTHLNFTITPLPGPSVCCPMDPNDKATLTYTDPEAGLEVAIEMEPQRAYDTFKRLTGVHVGSTAAESSSPPVESIGHPRM